MKKKQFKHFLAFLAVSAYLAFPVPAYAQSAGDGDEIDRLIEEQRQIADAMFRTRRESKNEEAAAENEKLQKEIHSLQKKLQVLQEEKKETYDARGAVHALTQQIADLQAQLAAQTEAQQALLSQIQTLQEKAAARTAPKPEPDSAGRRAGGNTARFLVQPAPNEKVSYTQDAVNAQGNSTMVFRYAPNQLYKI